MQVLLHAPSLGRGGTKHWKNNADVFYLCKLAYTLTVNTISAKFVHTLNRVNVRGNFISNF